MEIDMTNITPFLGGHKLFYKQILSVEETKELNDLFTHLILQHNYNSNIVTGTRYHIDFNIKSHPEFVERLLVTLNDYFSDLKIDPNARFYSHRLGGIKPHIDGNHDNICNYTMLLYLTADFDDGKLLVKTKRTEEEKLLEEPNKHHKVFTFIPKQGYAVIFNKSLLHWANEVYEGHKNFLLIHLNSCF
jgi:hypothetical protein